MASLINAHEFEQTLGLADGQGGPTAVSRSKEWDMTEAEPNDLTDSIN